MTTISINVAAKQAGNPEFMRSFAQALRETGFPRRFMIEVTEDAFVAKTLVPGRHPADLPRARRRHLDRRFRHRLFLAVGARRHHRRRDQDRSLVHHRHSHASAQPGHPARDRILSEALGMTVIAEGVESFEELAYLQAATKIRYAQGYYFARPIFLEELRPAAPLASDSRISLASRAAQTNRPAYSRGERYRR